MEKGRWFFALAPKALTENDRILRVSQRLRRTAKESEWDVRWTPLEHLHLTVGFIGEIDDAQKPQVLKIGEQVAAQIPAFDIDLKDLSAFPEPEAGRVVWVGVRRTLPLVELHDKLVEELAKAGLPPEREDFVPHVTLGRLRHVRHLVNWISPFKRQSFGEIHVDRLELFTSHTYGPKVVYQREGEWVLV